MKTLVIGKGGREHAIVKALSLSPSVSEVHVIPGSQGMAREALCHNISTSDDKAICEFVSQKEMDLVVIGPEAELAAGLADSLRSAGVLVFGPGSDAAQLEASKVFSKEFMNRAGIPTAKSIVVTSVKDIADHLSEWPPPYVLKADGLASGKGVFICSNQDELLCAARQLFEERSLGHAGLKALLEQSLEGWELSCLCITNGKDYQELALAQDHKRLKEKDEGPNTGGMGVVAPMDIDPLLHEQIRKTILDPTMKTISSMGMMFRGVIYVGLMITKDGPQVLEYNVRFGDPEAQVILPLIDGDVGEIMMSVARGDVPELHWKSLYSACVVLAAEGYPEKPVQDVAIEGDLFAETGSSYFLHAGTKGDGDGRWLTGGGRVLNAIGLGSSLREARENAYQQAKAVSWPGMQIRKDIGNRVSREGPLEVI